jgi:hypothetical protein
VARDAGVARRRAIVSEVLIAFALGSVLTFLPLLLVFVHVRADRVANECEAPIALGFGLVIGGIAAMKWPPAWHRVALAVAFGTWFLWLAAFSAPKCEACTLGYPCPPCIARWEITFRGLGAGLLTLAAVHAVRLVRAARRARVASTPVVLGQQLADARAAERARLAAGPTEASPMPGASYEAERGDFDLVTVVVLPLDRDLQALTQRFRNWTAEQRVNARRAISMDENYTLISFAKRSAVLALSEGSAERCSDGLTALAMIDNTRIDPRDGAWAAGLLSYAACAAKADRDAVFEQAAALATSGMAAILKRARKSDDLSDWGYAEIRTRQGVGLIRAGGAAYAPTLKLEQLALTIAETLNRGRYVASAEIAVDVPAVWFAKEHRGAAEEALKEARGAVSVSGKLRREIHKDAGMQMLMLWVVETPNATHAAALAGHVAGRSNAGGRFSVGVAHDHLFALLVGGSWTVGVEPFESPESLAEIAEQTRLVLTEAGAT